MKKITAIFTALALILNLCACASSGTAEGVASAEPELTYQDYYDLGLRYLSEGNYEEAILAFTAAIDIDSKQAPAYVGRGDAYVLSGETEENLAAAMADYKKAIELDETIAEAYLGLADVYVRQGDYEKALEILKQGLEKVGDNQRIADRMEEIETVSISAMIEQGNYDFLFTDDMAMPWDWKINGKALDKCELSDFQLEYPDESLFGLSVYGDGFSYRPGTKDSIIGNGNVEVGMNTMQLDISLMGEAYFEDEVYQPYPADFYYQPDLRNIRTNDSRAEVLHKIGFSDAGTAFVGTLKDDFSYTKCDSSGREDFTIEFSILKDNPHFSDVWVFPNQARFNEYPNARGMAIVFAFYDESLYSIHCFYNFL